MAPKGVRRVGPVTSVKARGGPVDPERRLQVAWLQPHPVPRELAVRPQRSVVARVRKLEATLGRPLPGAYREFLVTVAKGAPTAFERPCAVITKRVDASPGVFFGVDPAEDERDLLSVHEEVVDGNLQGLTAQHLPFAESAGGDLFVLGPRDEVLYWSHGKAAAKAVRPVADDFERFLALLQIDGYEEHDGRPWRAGLEPVFVPPPEPLPTPKWLLKKHGLTRAASPQAATASGGRTSKRSAAKTPTAKATPTRKSPRKAK